MMDTTTGMDYKVLFDLNPFPLIIYDPHNFKILDVNDAAVDLYGYSRTEMLSFKLPVLFYDTSLNELNTPGRLNGHSRIYHRKKDGTHIPLMVETKDVTFDGKPARLESIVPASPEPAADYVRLLFTSVIESSDDAIISKDMNGIILSWNKGAEKMYGYTAEEVIGKNIEIIAPPDKKEEVKEIMRTLAKGERYDHFETRRQTKDGRILWVAITVSPLKDASGKIIGASAIARNITKTKEAMAHLRDNEVIFKHLIENLTEVFYVSNPAKPEVIYMSNAYEKVFGESVQNIYENPGAYLGYIAEGDRQTAKRAIVKQLNGISTDNTYRVKRPDGKMRYLRERAFPVKDASGNVTRVIGIADDITERKVRELEISEALAREQKALFQAEEVQAKQKYLAEASYILNSSLDYSETIRSLAKLLTPAVCDWFAVDLTKGEKIDRLLVYHKDPEKLQFAKLLQTLYPPEIDEPSGVPDVIRTGRSELYSELSDEFLGRTIKDKELLAIFKKLGIKSLMIVPLEVRGKVLGALTLCTAESCKKYDENDLRFAEDIAHRAAIAIDNAALFRQIAGLNKNLEETIRIQQKEIKYRKKIERDLRESEERFRLITENSNDFISLLDENDKFIYANPSLLEELGYTADELIGKLGPDDLLYEDDRSFLQDYTRKPIIEIRYKKRSGGFVWVESSSLKVNYHGKIVTVRISRDITERKRIETERVKLYSQIEMQRIRIDNLVANVPGVVWESYGEPGSSGYKITFVSQYVEKLLGYKPSSWGDDPQFWQKVIHPDDAKLVAVNSRKQYRENVPMTKRFRWIAKDGSVLWIESQSTCIHDNNGSVIGLRGVNIDITEQIKFEHELSASLKEKEILLKEIHHRVKNNMQVISSLLSLQSKTIPDKRTQEIFDESRNRIRSMALIHEKLYQSKDLFNIDFSSYVKDLLNNLMISYGMRGKSIETKIDIGDLSFDINSAISLGLVINELASNSFKHAFKGRNNGEICITIRREMTDDGQVEGSDHNHSPYELIIKDNGIGLPEGEYKKTDSLGLELVETLINQLHGSIEMRSDQGTTARVTFTL